MGGREVIKAKKIFEIFFFQNFFFHGQRRALQLVNLYYIYNERVRKEKERKGKEQKGKENK